VYQIAVKGFQLDKIRAPAKIPANSDGTTFLVTKAKTIAITGGSTLIKPNSKRIHPSIIVLLFSFANKKQPMRKA